MRGIASEPKAQHPEQHFYHGIFKITSFLNFKRQIIRLAQGH